MIALPPPDRAVLESAQTGQSNLEIALAPTDPVPIVLDDVSGPHGEMVRWGLVPWWAKDIKVGARWINARSETVATNGAFLTTSAMW